MRSGALLQSKNVSARSAHSIVPFTLKMVALLLLLMTVVPNSQFKILNMPLILTPYQIWAGRLIQNPEYASGL